MLALTPAPLETAGERAFFGELTRWDTGASVRAAVVASLPLVDGPRGRRQADAVLFVPEGVAVIRVVEVLRQSGVVTARPEGAWTIGPEGAPGEVLQLSGGGSTPLDGLMRAGMDTAVKLRRAGLEPGRIARLTVLVGEVTGLVPADGDLGEGDQVATLDPRSLLLAFARASRHAGVDNPRLWTTADVRAGLEALELPGRGPTVEELNGEAFPYSPYVLRRPQLLTPAAMAASPQAAPPAGQVDPAPGSAERDAGSASGTAAPVQGGAPPSATAVARAVAASVASANAAEVAAAAPVPGRPGRRDTVEVEGPPAPPGGDAGIGGLFAGAERDGGGTVPPAGPRTAVLPAAPQAAEPAARPPLSPAWGAAPGRGATAAGRGVTAAGRGVTAAGRGVTAVDRGAGPGTPGRHRWSAVLIGAVVVLVALVVAGAWLLLGDDPDDVPGSGTPAPGPAATGPAAGDVRAVDGTDFTVEAVQVDDTCAGHAYGAVADFFAATDCARLSRALYSAEVDGAPVVVSVSRVTMSDAAVARELRALTDRNGSGNVNDLLREGVGYDGAPARLRSAEYASAVSGPTVTVVESAWVDPATAGSRAAVDKAASDGLALPVPPPPGG